MEETRLTSYKIYEFIPLLSTLVFHIPGGSKVSSKENMPHSKSSRSSCRAEDLHHEEPRKHKWIAATWRFKKGDILPTGQGGPQLVPAMILTGNLRFKSALSSWSM